MNGQIVVANVEAMWEEKIVPFASSFTLTSGLGTQMIEPFASGFGPRGLAARPTMWRAI